MKTTITPIDFSYFDWQGKNFIKIVGRDEKGKRVCVIDSCPVFLWAILEDNLNLKEIQKIITEIQKIEIPGKDRTTRIEKIEIHEKNFLGRKVQALKIFATNYKDLHDVADKLDIKGIEKRRGYDLGFVSHYLIEKEIVPLKGIEVEGELLNNSEEFGGIDSVIEVDECIKAEKIKSKEINFKPRILAYDIETDEFQIGEGEIVMVSLYGENFKKVISWKKLPEGKKPEYLIHVKDEEELIEKFVEEVKKYSPDFLVGYFSDGFDLPYLKARAEKNRIKLSLGLDGSQPKFSRGKELRGEIFGIVHIDLLKFIKTAYSQYMQSESLSLNEVSKEFLGDTKKDFDFVHSSKLDDESLLKYIEYNLHDSLLAYKLFEKMWPDISEFSRVMQEPTFDVTRNGMSKNVESYIIHNLKRFNEIPEKRPIQDEISERKDREKYEGAFVFEPTPGLYEDVVFFDFTSYWPSIIVTFNLSKSTLLEKHEANSNEVNINGKNFWFSKKPGFFPEMLKELIEKRTQYKEELKQKEDIFKRSRSNAFKLLANASYGYQGFFGARYYCPEASAATTAISRKIIKEIIEKINSKGYKTIYSDTDSIAFLRNCKSEKQVELLLENLNSELPGVMKLELEGFFERGLWVSTRDGSVGAKKKYALIDKKGKMKIRGFETVRRDWCTLARELQSKVINYILKEGNEKKALEYFKDVVKRLKKREINKEDILITTQIKKPLSEYKSITPHVIAAQKIKDAGLPITIGSLVKFYIAETKEKKKLIREKVKLPEEKGEYNIEYYLNNQILPAVENIFEVLGINTQELIEGKKQMKLF